MLEITEELLKRKTAETNGTNEAFNFIENIPKKVSFRSNIVWRKVIYFAVLHLFGMIGFVMCNTLSQFIYLAFSTYFFGLGISAGVHRLWCHRSYKAKLPLRVFLMLLNTSVLQDNIYIWCRDHRVHHKCSDTDADPYNSKRGFFFSQIGWLMLKKLPDVIEKGKTIDLSDILADPVVKFQIKYYVPLVIVTAVIAPSIIPYYLLNVSMLKCFCLYFCGRCIISLHATGLVNSAAHMWGYRPYNPSICPVENSIVSLIANGEGFHNYHHTFPWDYSSSEFGWRLNGASLFIDFMAWLGLAYDRKKVSKKLLEKFKTKYNSECVHDTM